MDEVASETQSSRLYVTPQRFTEPISNRQVKDGPVIIKNRVNGGTSGQYTVADVSARIFPLARAWVESRDNPNNYIFEPWPADRINRLSDFVVSYKTPEGADGLGTVLGPAPGREPIFGIVYLRLADGDPYLTRLAIRLKVADQHLYLAIGVGSIASIDSPCVTSTTM